VNFSVPSLVILVLLAACFLPKGKQPRLGRSEIRRMRRFCDRVRREQFFPFE
jgi:hypothetical protein